MLWLPMNIKDSLGNQNFDSCRILFLLKHDEITSAEVNYKWKVKWHEVDPFLESSSVIDLLLQINIFSDVHVASLACIR